MKKGEAEWPIDLVPQEARALLTAAGRVAPPFASGLFAECHLAHPTRTDLVVRMHPGIRILHSPGFHLPSIEPGSSNNAPDEP